VVVVSPEQAQAWMEQWRSASLALAQLQALLHRARQS
jgi:hypothetical protein